MYTMDTMVHYAARRRVRRHVIVQFNRHTYILILSCRDCHVCDYYIPRTNVHRGYYGSLRRAPPRPQTRRHVIVQFNRHTYILILSCRDYYWHHWQHHRHTRAVCIDANVIITDASIYLHYRVSGIIDAGDNITDMPAYANLHYRVSGIINADDNITDMPT